MSRCTEAGIHLWQQCNPVATVIDLDPGQDRTVIVQAGAFAEHTIEALRYTT